MLVVGNKYDDSELWGNVNDLKDRIAKLEKTVQTMNSEIGSIQSIVNAINDRDYSSESIFTKVSIIGQLRPMTKRHGYWIITGTN